MGKINYKSLKIIVLLAWQQHHSLQCILLYLQLHYPMMKHCSGQEMPLTDAL